MSTNRLAALGLDQEGLAVRLAAIVGVFGVLDPNSTRGVFAPGTVRVGDIVSVWAHNRLRAALVWKVGRTNLQAVHLTPTALEHAVKVRGPIRFWEAANVQGITARIEDVTIVGRFDEAGKVERLDQDQPLVGVEAQDEVTVDERAEDLLADAQALVEDETPAGGSAGARAAGVPAPALPEDGALFGLLDVPVVGALF